MYWASRRPTAWIRSVVPIVWRTHGEVAAQSPARGWAPPTTTTDRARQKIVRAMLLGRVGVERRRVSDAADGRSRLEGERLERRSGVGGQVRHYWSGVREPGATEGGRREVRAGFVCSGVREAGAAEGGLRQVRAGVVCSGVREAGAAEGGRREVRAGFI